MGDADLDCSESCDDTTDACEADDPESSACTDGTSTGTCDGAGMCLFGQGESCASVSDCRSGFCVDGICCDTACDAGCETCSGTGTMGTCSPAGAGAECRAATGECDIVETCSGTERTCPADVVEFDGTSCDGAAGVCMDGSCVDPGALDAGIGLGDAGLDDAGVGDGDAGAGDGDAGAGDADAGLSMPDAGPVVDDAGTAVSDASVLDAGGAADAGDGGEEAGDCGCSAPGRSAPGSLAWMLLPLALLVRRRRG